MKIKEHSVEISIVLLMLCFISEDSLGYINPSSGYILWQVLFGALVGMLFFTKRIYLFLRSRLIKEKSPDTSHP